MFTNSPNMQLPIPSVGSELGPAYAFDINAALTLVDSHDHTPGHGVAITPAGMDINVDLTFGGNAATNLRAAIFSPETSVPENAALYVSGVDFYLNDGNGNVIRVTQSGSLVGTPGSITGLPSGTAGVNFSGGTYTFSKATNTPGDIQAGSILIGNNVANSKYMTINPPNAMAANFSINFPNLPLSTQILQLDASGNISAALTVDNLSLQISGNLLSIKNNGITNAMLQADSVQTVNILDANVTTPKIADNAVTAAKYQANITLTGAISGSMTGGQYLTLGTIATHGNGRGIRVTLISGNISHSGTATNNLVSVRMDTTTPSHIISDGTAAAPTNYFGSTAFIGQNGRYIQFVCYFPSVSAATHTIQLFNDNSGTWTANGVVALIEEL